MIKTAREIFNEAAASKISKKLAIDSLMLKYEDNYDFQIRIDCLRYLDKLAKADNNKVLSFFKKYLILESEKVNFQKEEKVINTIIGILIKGFLKDSTSTLKKFIQQENSTTILHDLYTLLEKSSQEHYDDLKNELDKKLQSMYRAHEIDGKCESNKKYKIDTKIIKILFDIHSFCHKNNQNYEDDYSMFIYYTEKGKVIDLQLIDCNLETLPISMCQLSNLKYINLSGNRFKQLPRCLDQLKNLESVYVSGNLKLTRVPDLVVKLAKKNGSQEYIQEGVIEEEAWILALLKMVVGVDFYEYSKGINLSPCHGLYKLSNKGHIVYLSIDQFDSSESLFIIPEQLYGLKYLESLNINCSIKSIPNSIYKLKHLKRLSLVWNKIEKIPDSLGKLRNLESLDLSDNKIRSIPDSIKNLKFLEFLDLSDNKIDHIPDSIGELINLKELTLDRNQIQVIPESLTKLNNLKLLGLSDNPIHYFPEVLKKRNFEWF